MLEDGVYVAELGEIWEMSDTGQIHKIDRGSHYCLENCDVIIVKDMWDSQHNVPPTRKDFYMD